MNNENEKPDTTPKKTPDEMGGRGVNDVPEITEHEIPDELNKGRKPDRGTEKILDFSG